MPEGVIRKLVFVDLDGTIIDYTGRPFTGVPEAVAELRSRGIGVVLATGRMLCSAVEHVRRLGLQSTVIAYNGALVADTVTGAWFRHTPLPRNLAAGVAAAAAGDETTVMCFIEDRYQVNKMNDLVRQYEKRSNVSARVIPDLHRVLRADPTKLLIASTVPGRLSRVGSILAGLYGEQIYMARSRPGYLEVLVRGVDKGSAALFVCRRMGIEPGESAAFGDNMNDLELLSVIGFGATVEGAPEALKNIAGAVVASPESGGMAEALLALQ